VTNWDWVTISALATALGTMVLAAATFASVRYGNRAARNAERALLQRLRPLLFPSRLSDDPLKVNYADNHWVRVPGGHGVIDLTPDVAYLAMSLRNVGSGLGVLHGWSVQPQLVASEQQPDHVPLTEFRRLTRDLLVPPGDVFFWQGALRDPADPLYVGVVEAVRRETPVTIELLYGDEEGGQRTVTRYAMLPYRTQDGLVWLTSVGRHWNIDRPDPR